MHMARLKGHEHLKLAEEELGKFALADRLLPRGRLSRIYRVNRRGSFREATQGGEKEQRDFYLRP